MRAKSFFILFLFPVGLLAQWTDNFDTTSLHKDWNGQVNLWQLKQGKLQSDGPSVSGTCLSLSRGVLVGDSFELQALSSLNMATSSNNYLSFILKGFNKEWRIKLGGTPDEVSLYEDGLLVIDGMDKTLASSSTNHMGIRLRVKSGMVELAICPENDTLNWIQQGAIILDQFSIDSLLIEACYSSSNAHSFLIDAIRIGPIIYDQSPPKLTRHYLKEKNWLLYFSEPMDTNAAQLVGPDSNLISLHWESSNHLLISNLAHGTILRLRNFQDQNGNHLKDSVLRLSDPKLPFRAIQITEIMADPSPPKGLPDIEWLELMNGSGYPIELSFFQLMDASTSIPFPDYLFPANSYLLLSSECSLMKSFGPCLPLAMSSSFLNNAGDDLRIIHRNGDTLESLQYSSSWYKDPNKENGGYSLEKRDPLNPCLMDDENFIASTNLLGGTPGKLNAMDERILDQSPPELLEFDVLGPRIIRLRFSESLHELGWALLEDDSLELVPINEKEYQLHLDEDLVADPNRVWTLNLIKQEDCTGNRLQDTGVNFRYAIPEIPRRGELIFTELLFLPSTKYAPFVEVFNRSEKALTLAGTTWGNGSSERVIGNHMLYPGESLIFCKKADTLNFEQIPKDVISTMPSFSKSGHLWMKNVEDQMIDGMYYADSFFMEGKANAGAYSLIRLDSLKPCAGVSDWAASESPGGTPGSQNFQVMPNTVGVAKLWHIYPINASQLRLTYSGPLGIEPPEIQINASGHAVDWSVWNTDFNSWVLTWSEAFLPFTAYRLTQKESSGCNGAYVPAQSLAFEVPGNVKGLRLNEILFDPIDDEPDYIELVNWGENAIDLRGLFLGSYSSSGVGQDFVEFAPDGYLLMPGAYVLITEGEHLLGKHFPAYSSKNTLLVNRLPSYPNSGGGVIVFDSIGQVLDSFLYSPSMHSSLLVQSEGVSLERIDPNFRGPQSGNWISASASENFGTPGYENSQRRKNVKTGTKHWSLASASFSPDGDGFEDQAMLRYADLKPGCTATITVHALNGVKVGDWANNLPIGTKGQLLWEGQDGFGMPLGDGPYLVVIAWTDREGNSQHERLVLVKASKH